MRKTKKIYFKKLMTEQQIATPNSTSSNTFKTMTTAITADIASILAPIILTTNTIYQASIANRSHKIALCFKNITANTGSKAKNSWRWKWFFKSIKGLVGWAQYIGTEMYQNLRKNNVDEIAQLWTWWLEKIKAMHQASSSIYNNISSDSPSDTKTILWQIWKNFKQRYQNSLTHPINRASIGRWDKFRSRWYREAKQETQTDGETKTDEQTQTDGETGKEEAQGKKEGEWDGTDEKDNATNTSVKKED